jgi:mRNA degradation ribonuclease J1/J2
MHFHQLHASGHMAKDQLVEMVNYINSKKTFPVHTEHQELFKSYVKNIETIKSGKEYTIN